MRAILAFGFAFSMLLLRDISPYLFDGLYGHDDAADTPPEASIYYKMANGPEFHAAHAA